MSNTVRNYKVLIPMLLVIALMFGLRTVGAGQAASFQRALFGGPPPGMVSYQGVV